MNTGPTNHLLLRIFVCLFLLLGLLNAASQTNTKSIRLVTKETSLGKVPLMADLNQKVISPDSQHVAFPVMRGGQWTVWHDGVEGGRFKAIQSLTFSPDGKRLAYFGVRGGLWRENSDRQDVKQSLASVILEGAKYVAVADGQEGPEYDSLGRNPPMFSPDSQRVAYAARRGSKWRVVVNEQAGIEYNGTKTACPSPQPRKRTSSLRPPPSAIGTNIL